MACLRAVGVHLGADREFTEAIPTLGPCSGAELSPGSHNSQQQARWYWAVVKAWAPGLNLLTWSPSSALHQPHSFSPYPQLPPLYSGVMIPNLE